MSLKHGGRAGLHSLYSLQDFTIARDDDGWEGNRPRTEVTQEFKGAHAPGFESS
jgi:hypothetical protein